jgi:hypothetical protein
VNLKKTTEKSENKNVFIHNNGNNKDFSSKIMVKYGSNKENMNSKDKSKFIGATTSPPNKDDNKSFIPSKEESKFSSNFPQNELIKSHNTTTILKKDNVITNIPRGTIHFKSNSERFNKKY